MEKGVLTENKERSERELCAADNIEMNVLRRYSMEKGDDSTKKDHSFYRRNKRSLVLYAGCTIFIVVFIVVDVAIDHPWNLVSLSGIVIFTILTYIFSKDRSKVAWHTIFWGFALQFIFGLIIMRTAWGAGSVRWVGDRFTEFTSYSEDGSAFVFGDNYNEHRFAFKTLPSIIVFCAAIELLSHLGVINFIVKNIGGFLGYCLTTTPAESINAAANIFIG
ncbi:hypothetical protein ScPMuIL_016296 [Solemya velum]